MSTSQIIISVCTFFSVVFIASGYSVVTGVRERTAGRFTRQTDYIQKRLENLFIRDVTANQVIALTVLASVVAAVFIYMITGSLIVMVIVGLGAPYLLDPVLNYLHRKRVEKFEEQLPAGLDQMASSAKAGLSLAQIIEDAALNAPKHVAEEFSLIHQDYQLGTNLEDAIEIARKRLDSKLFNLLATALIVNREKGGNLPEALETMSIAFKEIARLEQKLITASAEGRKAVKMISGMPVFIFLMVWVAEPELIDSLTHTVPGVIILIIALLIYALSVWWLIKVLKIEV